VRAALIVALVVATETGTGLAVPTAPSAAPRAVPYDTIIGHAGSGRQGGYRVVLRVVSVPPAYLPQTVLTDSRPWRFWSKSGLLVHANDGPVTVGVPRAWRRRVAIEWGNSGIVHILRIARCPRAGKAWNAYAGGFHLRARSACVPLVFRVGLRSATVQVGVGRRCGAH
jgi:hypothetical protein